MNAAIETTDEAAADPPIVSGKCRVGILTFHSVQNFGGLWQAFGLSNHLRRRGHQVELINYAPAHVERGSRLRLPTSRQNLIANATTIYQKTLQLRRRMFADREQQKKFVDFQQRYLPNSGQPLTDADQLDNAGLDYDCLVCGSDQIWNPSAQHGIDPVYFGQTKVNCRSKGSYAASFGSGGLAPAFHSRVLSALRTFEYLSVREDSGRRTLADIPLSAHVDVDPTLLNDDYGELFNIETSHDGDELVLYSLRGNRQIDRSSEVVAQRMGKQLTTLHASRDRPRSGRGHVFPGPIQWLQRIATAGAMVTNSYHGTIFSILFEKPFVTCSIGGRKRSLDDRSRSLLDRLGLSARLVQPDATSEIHQTLQSPIQWDEVRQRRRELADESKRRFHSWLDQYGNSGPLS